MWSFYKNKISFLHSLRGLKFLDTALSPSISCEPLFTAGVSGTEDFVSEDLEKSISNKLYIDLCSYPWPAFALVSAGAVVSMEIRILRSVFHYFPFFSFPIKFHVQVLQVCQILHLLIIAAKFFSMLNFDYGHFFYVLHRSEKAYTSVLMAILLFFVVDASNLHSTQWWT